MKVKIAIDMAGGAFAEDATGELDSLLDRVKEALHANAPLRPGMAGSLLDSWGSNRCVQWKVTR